MAWKALNLNVPPHQVDAITDALMQLGALSVSVEDADAHTVREQALFDEGTALDESEPKFWKLNLINALFAEDAEFAPIIAALETVFGHLQHRMQWITEQNWLELVRDQFQPIRIHQKLWIVPSWHEPPDTHAHCVRLDPGLAFGTGTHPSTRLCLEWLSAQNLAQTSVLDYGCGSGILAIAAKMLGADYVRGVDIDAQAILASIGNAQQNGVAIEFIDAHTGSGGGQFDIVLANILSKTLITLADSLAATCKPAAKIALSGILETQADEVSMAFATWFEMHIESTLEGWVLLIGKRH